MSKQTFSLSLVSPRFTITRTYFGFGLRLGLLCWLIEQQVFSQGAEDWSLPQDISPSSVSWEFFLLNPFAFLAPCTCAQFQLPSHVMSFKLCLSIYHLCSQFSSCDSKRNIEKRDLALVTVMFPTLSTRDGIEYDGICCINNWKALSDSETYRSSWHHSLTRRVLPSHMHELWIIVPVRFPLEHLRWEGPGKLSKGETGSLEDKRPVQGLTVGGQQRLDFNIGCWSSTLATRPTTSEKTPSVFQQSKNRTW